MTSREKLSQAAEDIRMSVMRTIVPLLVMAISSTVVGQWIDQETLTVFIGALVSIVWYTAVRLLEETKNPAVGVLIGGRSAPRYDR